MPIEKQIKRSPSNVIAKLMGLDTLPSPRSPIPRNEAKKCFPKVEEQLPQQYPSFKKHNDSRQEFKDVFEVMEAKNHKNQYVREQMPNNNHNETGFAFIRQSFINAKRLFTDEKLQRSKEFGNALEVLESNKDLFLKLLEEPRSFSSPRRIRHPPSSYAGHALVQKSLRNTLNAINDSQTQKKPISSPNGHQTMCSLQKKLSEKAINHGQFTQIVILKPSFEKARKVESAFRSVKSINNTHCSVINPRELPKEVFQEENGRVKFDTRRSIKLTRNCVTEVGKEASRQRRNTSVSGRKESLSKYCSNVQDDSLCPMPSFSNANDDSIYEHGKGLLSPLSSSFESLVNLEASKRLYEQWRLVCHERGLSTSEMLVLSDSETLKPTRNAPSSKQAHPLSTSSNNVRKDGFFPNLPRSKSLPSSSLVYEDHQWNTGDRVISSKSKFMPDIMHNMSEKAYVDEDGINPKNFLPRNLTDFRKKSKLYFDGEGNGLPVREIHVNSEELKHESFAISKQASVNQSINELLLPSYCPKSMPASSDNNCKETDQPSPVSVFELPTSRCFKNPSADLQDPLARLQFLKLDSTDSLAKEIDAFISPDDTGEAFPYSGDIIQSFRDEDDRNYSYLIDMLMDSRVLKSEKNDLSGAFHSTEFPVSIDVFEKLELKYKSVVSWPRSERKLFFNLVNHTLSDSASTLCTNMCHWTKPTFCRQTKMVNKGLIEEIWQALVKHMNDYNSSFSEESIIERWLDIGNELDVVGRELENMLYEQLINQLVKELM